MVGFNNENLKNLMAKLSRGEEMMECLRKINMLDVPINLAKELKMIETFKRWIPYGEMGKVCFEIVEKLQLKEEKNDKEEEKNKKNRKRPSTEAGEVGAKKNKKSEKSKEEEKENEKEEQKKKSVPKKKKFAPLFAKAMRDRKLCRL